MSIDQHEPNLVGLNIHPEIMNHVYLGRCNFDYKSDCTAPEGQFTDVNIWSKPLTKQEMIDWTTCNTMSKGDALNWDTAQWELVNMTTDFQDVSTICKPIRPGHVVLPEMRNFTSHTAMCRKFRGGTSVVQDLESQMVLSKELNMYKSCSHNSSKSLQNCL